MILTMLKRVNLIISACLIVRKPSQEKERGGRDRPEDMSVEMGGKRDQSCPDLREFTKWVDIWGWPDTLLL